MPKPTETANVQPPSDLAVSVRRRYLLKAAASAAPLIATLPSGAARANSSTYQCVLNAQGASLSEDAITASPTALLRQRLVKLTRTNVDGTTTKVYYGYGENLPDKNILENFSKNWWLRPAANSIVWWEEENAREFRPLTDPSKPPAAPDGWTARTTEAYGLRLFGTDGLATGIGYDHMDFIPSERNVQDTKFPLNGSCLCSVDPQSNAYCDFG